MCTHTTGLEPFDGVNVFGFNSPEWLMGELAAIMAGGVAAGIYPTDMPDQVVYKSQHSSGMYCIPHPFETIVIQFGARGGEARQGNV